ncbi:MAG TPA: AAA family ATPase [Candidatus Saccharimonadales bacterium]|nr:AAA family ATPase [Candidatus Saccharimonadales bacterium]
MAKLIVLRGPSGAGKSTVARALHEALPGLVVLIEQDHYREVMLRPKGAAKEMRLEMMRLDVELALKHNATVILEGILSVEPHKEFFEALFAHHPTDNYMFYFDISLEETVKRHGTRSKSELFGEAELKEWYVFAQRSDYPFEQIVPETLTTEQTVARIREETGL